MQATWWRPLREREAGALLYRAVAEPGLRVPVDRSARSPQLPSHARLRIMLTYLWRHRRLPKLAAPELFSELIQQRKLFDRDERLSLLADKLRVKDHVADLLGTQWVIPTLWHGSELPMAPIWPRPFVLKSRHGCNQRAFVRTGFEDWTRIRNAAARWLRAPYGIWLDEWAYRGIPRGLLVEPFIGQADRLPIDYKLFVFGGRVAYIQVHLDREGRHRWVVLDRGWRRVSAPTADDDPPRPVSLAAMIEAAEALAQGFDFVRVDLYEVAGCPLFGEMTFYPGSGLYPFDPLALDRAMGAHWRRARSGGAEPGVPPPAPGPGYVPPMLGRRE